MSKLDELRELLGDMEFGDSEREAIQEAINAASEEHNETLSELENAEEYSADAEREYNDMLRELTENRERVEKLSSRLEEALASEEEYRSVLDDAVERLDALEEGEVKGSFPDAIRLEGIRIGGADNEDFVRLSDEERDKLEDGFEIKNVFRQAVENHRENFGDFEARDEGNVMPDHVAALQAVRTVADMPRFEPTTGSNVTAKL